jgi:hypothetical protein
MISDAAPFSRAIRPMILPIPEAPPVINTFVFLNFIMGLVFSGAKVKHK